MAAGQQRNDSAAYRPTSIDFINLPNPIQPAPASQRHPLNGTPQLEKARLESGSKNDIFRLALLGPSDGRSSSKRPRSTENLHLDLPKLPVRNNAKRLRIPPTLSGLHQPPPDAGLLPSINVEQPAHPPPRLRDAEQPTAETAVNSSAAAGSTSTASGQALNLHNEQSKAAKKSTRQRNKWTAEETEDLLKGVSRFGVGSWTRIWNCSDYHFHNRTALDLKDRFRICFPDYNKKSKKSGSSSRSGEGISSGAEDQQTTVRRAKRGPAPERVAPSTLEKLGINEPFEKTERRARHGYSTAEDEALLKGFKKHGKAWTAIMDDSDLGLSARKATDLRDRMRTRFPEEYAQAGLAPRTKKQATTLAQAPRVDDDAADDVCHLKNSGSSQPNAWTTNTSTPSQASGRATSNTHARSSVQPKTAETRRPHQPSLFSLDDIYLARLSDDEEDAEHERITLDRGILDWAPSTARVAPIESTRPPDIDPLMLTLPKRIPPMHAPDPPLSQGGQGNNTTSLPSLASLVPLPEGSNSAEQMEQLPSLTEWWVPPQENDSRSGGASLEDILGSAL